MDLPPEPRGASPGCRCEAKDELAPLARVPTGPRCSIVQKAEKIPGSLLGASRPTAKPLAPPRGRAVAVLLYDDSVAGPSDLVGAKIVGSLRKQTEPDECHVGDFAEKVEELVRVEGGPFL